jgi:glycosyltransferase involved in cell wall biosynthesis
MDNPNIKCVFLGDGRYRGILEKKVIEYGLQNTVFFPGRFALDTMPVFMKRADVLLVSLKDELIFNLTIPAKVQFYMAQGKPILGMLNGDGADLISNAKCGYCVPAGDYRAYSEIIKKICKEKKELEILGQNGKKYYEEHFQKKDRIYQLETVINKD